MKSFREYIQEKLEMNRIPSLLGGLLSGPEGPSFTKAMQNKMLKKAQKIAKNSLGTFALANQVMDEFRTFFK